MMADLSDLNAVEQVCWLAAGEGGRVDLTRPRSPNAQRKINAALAAGAITGNGWLTQTGIRIAEEVDDG